MCIVLEVGSVLCRIDSAHLVQPKKEASKKYVESSPSIKFEWSLLDLCSLCNCVGRGLQLLDNKQSTSRFVGERIGFEGWA